MNNDVDVAMFLEALLSTYFLAAQPAFPEEISPGTGVQIRRSIDADHTVKATEPKKKETRSILVAKNNITGRFKGLNRYTISGNVEIHKDSRGYVIEFKSDFSSVGAPEPRIGFGRDGSHDTSTMFAPLKKDQGRQLFRVPAHIDPIKYNEVYVYSERLKAELAVAPLS